MHFNAMKHGQFNNVLKYEKIFGAQIFDERYLQAMLLGKNTQISFVLFDCFYYRLVLKWQEFYIHEDYKSLFFFLSSSTIALLKL